jgi:hypothetical protein
MVTPDVRKGPLLEVLGPLGKVVGTKGWEEVAIEEVDLMELRLRVRPITIEKEIAEDLEVSEMLAEVRFLYGLVPLRRSVVACCTKCLDGSQT